MKRLLSFLCIGFLLIFLVGCGSTDTTDTTEDVTTEEEVMDESTDDTLAEDIIGTWEATVAEDEASVDNEVQASAIEEISFDENMNFTEKLSVSETGDTENITASEIAGTYKVDGEEVTLTIDTIDGQTKEEYTEAVGDTMTADEINSLYESVTYTALVEDDTLTLSNDTEEITLTKLVEEA